MVTHYVFLLKLIVFITLSRCNIINMLELYVDKKDPDRFPTVQEALNSVPYEESAIIYIGKGVFKEKLFADKNDITLIGQGVDETVITFSDYGHKPHLNGLKLGTFRSYTAFFSGEKLTLKNLSIKNEAGRGQDVGQGVALYLDSKNVRCENVHLFGHQDTLFISPLPLKEREKYGFKGPREMCERKRCNALFRDSLIEGDIDFIFGGGNARFENCTINALSSGYVCAPAECDKGFVFYNCKFLAPKGCDVYIMRSWRDGAKVSLIECDISPAYNKNGALKWNEREQNHIYVYGLNREFENSIKLTKEQVFSL